MKRVASKYLDAWGEPEARPAMELFQGINKSYAVGLAIPMCGESHFQERLLTSLALSANSFNGKALVIFVVNARQSASTEIHESNRQTLTFLNQQFRKTHESGLLTLFENERFDLLCIDRSSRRFLPEKQGVGLARKIGNDCLTALVETGTIQNDVFANTDGDAAVPEDFFGRLADLAGKSGDAFIFPFSHVRLAATEAIWRATQKYEKYLHYYVQGLQSAGSPFCHISLGSTIAMRSDAYLNVRGHPKKLAGEDFYILDKIAKLGISRTGQAQIHHLDGSPILLAARESERVPFGTGRATIAIQADGVERYKVYDPSCFTVLKDLLDHVRSALGDAETECFLTEEAKKTWDHFDLSLLIEHSRSGTETCDAAWRKFSIGFDGLKTLKCIHYIRDEFYPNLLWEQALNPQTT